MCGLETRRDYQAGMTRGTRRAAGPVDPTPGRAGPPAGRGSRARTDRHALHCGATVTTSANRDGGRKKVRGKRLPPNAEPQDPASGPAPAPRAGRPGSHARSPPARRSSRARTATASPDSPVRGRDHVRRARAAARAGASAPAGPARDLPRRREHEQARSTWPTSSTIWESIPGTAGPSSSRSRTGGWSVTTRPGCSRQRGAHLVHSAPSTGVRDWSDLRIAVAAGIWLAAARPGRPHRDRVRRPCVRRRGRRGGEPGDRVPSPVLSSPEGGR